MLVNLPAPWSIWGWLWHFILHFLSLTQPQVESSRIDLVLLWEVVSQHFLIPKHRLLHRMLRSSRYWCVSIMGDVSPRQEMSFPWFILKGMKLWGLGQNIMGKNTIWIIYLVGGLEHGWIIFHFIKKGCHPKPIDELHHFSRWLKPPTSYKSIEISWTKYQKSVEITIRLAGNHRQIRSFGVWEFWPQRMYFYLRVAVDSCSDSRDICFYAQRAEDHIQTDFDFEGRNL